ncbi:FliH/SctL family protein [Legionella fairfieldensis]|uniref:FliH/SctL family protein n=1 Tax=Legionella fairfieldensis TaxID=45064 RepID=UPI00048AD45E|nr:FliH/SctL family protein [Legionella fairfieldensis]
MAEIFKQVVLSDEPFYPNQTTATAKDTAKNQSGTASPAVVETPVVLKEKAHEEGYAEGYTQGLTKGKEEGEKQAHEEVANLLQQLETLLQTIPAAISENRQALQTEIADIVLIIAQQFFIQQQHDKEFIARQISAALNQLNSKQTITLVLHPHDVALLQQGKLTIDFSQCNDLRIASDEKLRLGGCLIKSEHGLFDASIERQVDRLKQILLQIKAGEHDV